MIPDEAIISDYYELRQQLNSYRKDMREVMIHPNYALKFAQPGRLVTVKHQDHDFGWGVIVNFNQRRPSKGQQMDVSPQQSYIVDVLLCISEASATSTGAPSHRDFSQKILPPDKGEKGKMEVVPVLLSCIESISHLRVFLPNDLRSADQRRTVHKTLEETKKRFPDGFALLDPVENMGITDESFKKLLRVSTTGVTLMLVAN